MVMALQLRPRFVILRNPIIVNLFSSSSSDGNGGEDKKDPQPPPPVQSASPMSPFFSEVKASLKQQPTPRRIFQDPPQGNPPFSSSRLSQSASLKEIQKNLSEFRSLSGSLNNAKSSPSPPNSHSKHVSFYDLYKRNVIEKNEEGNNTTAGTGRGGIFQFDAIRDSLKKLKTSQRGGPDTTVRKGLNLHYLQDSLRLNPDTYVAQKSSVVSGGSETVLSNLSVEEKSISESPPSSKNELIRIYKYDELGEKLRRLRPADAKPGKNWFSLSELNERLIKLREIEEAESKKKSGGVNFTDLRESLVKLQFNNSEAEAKKKLTSQSLDILGHLGGTPSYMLSPPKEHLVEKYFHPDNMSSADKLKLELKKIRDEFKMSESDCGSSRVQVAQLTVKIKHLSSALHKKDKHSRKGLQEMVVRRKKLLKYLRRTDWDSYCFCLSKLGLRDNPDYKN